MERLVFLTVRGSSVQPDEPMAAYCAAERGVVEQGAASEDHGAIIVGDQQ